MGNNTIVFILCSILIIAGLSGCAGAGFSKRLTAIPDEIKLRPEWSEDIEGDFNCKKVSTELVWKLK